MGGTNVIWMGNSTDVACFKWAENISQGSKDFIEDSQEEVHEICFLEVDVQYYNVQ